MHRTVTSRAPAALSREAGSLPGEEERHERTDPALTAALSTAAAEETWTGVALVDTLCYEDVKNAPDEHTTSCALQCVKGGYGLITAEGEFLRFDAAGNEQTHSVLEATEKKKGLRASVVGTRDGESVTVRSIRLE